MRNAIVDVLLAAGWVCEDDGTNCGYVVKFHTMSHPQCECSLFVYEDSISIHDPDSGLDGSQTISFRISPDSMERQIRGLLEFLDILA